MPRCTTPNRCKPFGPQTTAGHQHSSSSSSFLILLVLELSSPIVVAEERASPPSRPVAQRRPATSGIFWQIAARKASARDVAAPPCVKTVVRPPVRACNHPGAAPRMHRRPAAAESKGKGSGAEAANGWRWVRSRLVTAEARAGARRNRAIWRTAKRAYVELCARPACVIKPARTRTYGEGSRLAKKTYEIHLTAQ